MFLSFLFNKKSAVDVVDDYRIRHPQNTDIKNLLIRAIEMRNIELCKKMIAQGAGVNRQITFGATPLFFAANSSTVEICELLIEKGAKVDAVDYDNSTPLHEAACKGNFEICKLLISHGAKASAVDSYGYKPADYALQNKFIDLYKYLNTVSDDEYLRIKIYNRRKHLIHYLL
jgi:ankyrin repeat protein